MPDFFQIREVERLARSVSVYSFRLFVASMSMSVRSTSYTPTHRRISLPFRCHSVESVGMPSSIHRVIRIHGYILLVLHFIRDIPSIQFNTTQPSPSPSRSHPHPVPIPSKPITSPPHILLTLPAQPSTPTAQEPPSCYPPSSRKSAETPT